MNLPLREGGIASLRIRLGCFGRPVLQIQRHTMQFRIPDDGHSYYESIGLTQWKDACRDDALEIAVYMRVEQGAPPRAAGHFPPIPDGAVIPLPPWRNPDPPSGMKPPPPPNPPPMREIVEGVRIVDLDKSRGV